MPFKKGQSGNKDGRPKGKPNKITQSLRESLKQIAEGQIEDVEKALEKLKEENPAAYLDRYEKLLSYTLPKKRDITSDDKPIQPAINISEHRTEPETD
jgi:hypothetical protein